MKRTLNQFLTRGDMTESRITPHRPRALVTGGAVRVGRAIALALARAGMDVAIGYHRSARAARRTVRELQAAGARALALRADLADPGAARGLVRDAARRLGGLDVLVNNPAVFERTPFLPATAAQHAPPAGGEGRGAGRGLPPGARPLNKPPGVARSATASRGCPERWGVWGPMWGPPIS